MRINWGKKNTYFIDENMKLSDKDIKKLNKCNIINSTNLYPEGTPDEVLTAEAKNNGWIIVTKDIRMALRSLQDNVPVIYISDYFKTISYLSVSIYGRSKYPEMFDFIQERFGYSVPK